MPTPLHASAYPLVMLDAITRVCASGEPLEIPTQNPTRTRLQFHGLKAALRREGKAELADPWAISIPKDNPPRIVIYLRENSQLAAEIGAALGNSIAAQPAPNPFLDDLPVPKTEQKPVEEAEAAFRRILGF